MLSRVVGLNEVGGVPTRKTRLYLLWLYLLWPYLLWPYLLGAYGRQGGSGLGRLALRRAASQRQITPQAAPSFSQPRPINRSGTRWHPNPTASHIGLAFGTTAITYRRGLLYCSAGPGPLCVLLDCSRPRSRLGRDEMWRLLKRVVLPADPLPEEATQYYT